MSWKAPLASLVALVLGCAPSLPVGPGDVPPTDCPGHAGVSHTIYLIGDAGAPRLPAGDEPRLVDPVLRSLQAQVRRSVQELGADQVAVVFLGDNVYQRGLVQPGEPERRHGERVLEAQIAAAGEGLAFFTAGNHDWDMEGPRGWDHILEQRAFLEKQGPRVSMYPPGGCAGPVTQDVGRWLRFVFIDPIGFAHLEDAPDVHHERCPDEQNVRDQYLDLSDAFDHPDGRHVVLVVHHPLITAGPHGGHYTWKQHIFPLTDFVPSLWLPLPIIGSVYPLSRQLGVTSTDVTNEFYAQYVFGIYRAATSRAPVLVAAGHEHSLQVHRDWLGMTYAVSGAGSAKKVNRVEPLDTVLMSAAVPGYMRLDSHADGALGLSVFGVDPDTDLPLGLDIFDLDDASVTEPIYRSCIAEGPLPERRRGRQRQ